MKKTILTGFRPTGPLHIGHYVGLIKQIKELQHDYNTFVLCADIQALTDNFTNPKKIKDNIYESTLDLLACGIDPEIATIYLQSRVPETAELFVLISNFVSLQKVSHNPTVKQEIKEKQSTKKEFKESTPLGFFMYPVHQVADILTVNADLVPVGDDQNPMVELTRDIATKFNKTYNTDLLKIPEIRNTKMSRLCGTDGNAKMGKSLGNVINLKDTKEEVKNKIKRMYTDPNRLRATDPGKVEGNPVFIYHDTFNENTEEVKELKDRYRKGTVGDVEVKDKLFLAIEKTLEPIRIKREELLKEKNYIENILEEGTKKTRKVAKEILDKVKGEMYLS